MDFKRQKRKVLIPRIDILGVGVDDISFKDAVESILEYAKDKKGGKYVVTVNSEFVMLARKNPKFSEILKTADLAVADGAGVVFSKLILGGKCQERVTGVDLLEILCKKSAEKAITVGFLGGFGSVAEIVSKRQKAKYKGLKVRIAEAGDPTMGYDLRLKKRFLEVGRVDILFVAYGMGQQEFWIRRNLKKLDVGVFIGVGGAFDYVAGVKKRAPKAVQTLNLEWMWRLFWEPKRAWRMRVLPVFLALIAKKRLEKFFK